MAMWARMRNCVRLSALNLFIRSNCKSVQNRESIGYVGSKMPQVSSFELEQKPTPTAFSMEAYREQQKLAHRWECQPGWAFSRNSSGIHWKSSSSLFVHVSHIYLSIRIFFLSRLLCQYSSCCSIAFIAHIVQLWSRCFIVLFSVSFLFFLIASFYASSLKLSLSASYSIFFHLLSAASALPVHLSSTIPFLFLLCLIANAHQSECTPFVDSRVPYNTSDFNQNFGVS